MRRVLLFLPPVLVGVATLAACVDSPRQPSQRQPARTAQRPVKSPSPDVRQCLSMLGAQQAVFTPVEDRYYGNSCSTVGTVKLAALNTDNATVTVSGLGPATCGVATPFAAWARYGVDRAAQQILGSRVVKIETFGSYSCRNVAGTNRRSGHASANAIDVSGFVLGDGRRITILDDWNGGTPAERRFLRTVHDSACKRFGTTLGPAYNAAHANHLHLEADGADFCR
ncbi:MULTISPECIES: extensin family protein [unclassified Novosphingobium]|uniref:extensin-like domain-containing protein n=1 Tax=unclassified Novosphingobium TaxID=2644732 RepID=UPI00135A88AB|nr:MULTISPECIES: extensin family protein [unclassified Novosphingobium]